MGCPSPEPGTHWRMVSMEPSLCVGRYEGTDMLLGRRGSRCQASLQSSPRWRSSLNKCLVQPWLGCTCAEKPSEPMRPTVDAARPWKAEKTQKPALRASLSLDKECPHKC